jgi:hypothetical protein
MTASITAPATERADVRISAAVRGLIAQHRTTPAAVAPAVDMKRSTLYNRLNNASPWEADEVERLSHFFGVSRDSLYEGRSEFALTSAPGGIRTPKPSDPKVDGHFLRPRRDRRRRRDWQRTAAPVHLSVVRCEDAA